MDIFDKVKNFTNSAVNYMKSKSAQNNPEALITDAERRVAKSKKAAGSRLLAIQELTLSIKKEMKNKENELLSIKECINLAVAEKDKELLVSLLLEQEEAENAYIAQKKLYDGAVADAVKISDNYKRFEADINMLLKDLASLKTRAQFLKMREQIVLTENQFEQSALTQPVPSRQQCCDYAKEDLVKKNSSRKRALERASALLQEN